MGHNRSRGAASVMRLSRRGVPPVEACARELAMGRPIARHPIVLTLTAALWTGLGFEGRAAVGAVPAPRVKGFSAQAESVRPEDFENLRLAIDDLSRTYAERYPQAESFRRRLDALAAAFRAGKNVTSEFQRLRDESLLANPLMDFDRLLVLKRKRGQLGLPTNHQCNSCLPQTGYDNELAILQPVRPTGTLTTLFRPPGDFYVGEMDLHWDADRLLFTMPNGRTWQIWEIRLDGTGVRQVSKEEADVDNFDACYLPDGGIAYASTASFTAVPCWHGKERACAVFRMEADGSARRQLCFDQDLDLHPAVLPSGEIVFSRWDYSGPMHMYLRLLMVMNPDGTHQRAIYGSNSYYPNALYFPRAIPGTPAKLVAILSGYHGVNRAGDLVVVDYGRGSFEASGIVHRAMHRREPIRPIIRDDLVGPNWPKFLHPYPLSDRYFLAAVQKGPKAGWGIYLVDVFDNMVPILADPGYDFFEPIPVRKSPRPPVIPPQVDLGQREAIVYLQDIYRGPGLAGVPRGTVKRLRIVGYHWGFPGMAGPDKAGRAGPWDVMRILGTVPVEADGSALFRVPANTPIAVQPLDDQGRALQLMRSWYTAMPGERVACVGCHEAVLQSPPAQAGLAALRPPSAIEPWFGPPRGFDFEREVQPVLDRYCVGCHNGQPGPNGQPVPDLRGRQFRPDYTGLPLSKLGADRLWPEVAAGLPAARPTHQLLGNRNYLYTPAYEALIPFIRRVNIEDDVRLLTPCEYSADTSELVQMLHKGHYGVTLDPEAWSRLYTWIDLNGPCHGRWGAVLPVPRQAPARRLAVLRASGGPDDDPEQLPPGKPDLGPPVLPQPRPRPSSMPKAAGWPFSAQEATRRQRQAVPWTKSVTLAPNLALELVFVPPGCFVMGATDGESDEAPPTAVEMAYGFWMSRHEITNQQYRAFDPNHDSRLFTKRSLNPDGPGVPMNEPHQPVVRVSWEEAMAFCRWLSQRTGLHFRLPTEAEWEYACRAGSATAFHWGGLNTDFAEHANMADAALARLYTVTGGVVNLQPIPADQRYDDGALATAAVGRYRPNPWSLCDMHGNAAEWTLTLYRPYPYCETDGRNDLHSADLRVVRGGSFYDRPWRCRSAFRLAYRPWQKVHNVGFRVVCTPMGEPPPQQGAAR